MLSIDQQELRFGPFRVDRYNRSLTRDGVTIPISGRGLDILFVLVSPAGEIIHKDVLLEQVWPGMIVEENNLQVQISALRKALGDGWIVTVPRRGYRFDVPRHGGSAASLMIDEVTSQPSIAVLPFDNLGGDRGQDYFSDGIAEDIITELSRVRSLLVIARSSSFAYRNCVVDVREIARKLNVRYVLSGSMRLNGDRVRISAQLVDAPLGAHIWAERFERPLQDLFLLQDEITTAVTWAVTPAVAAAEQRRVLRKSQGNLGAWEAYHRGMWHLAQSRYEDFQPAAEFFRRALELDPNHAAAHAGLAVVYCREGSFFASRPLDEATVLSLEEARKAVELDPADAEAHAHLAFALANRGDTLHASEHAERAISINPSCAPAYRARGFLLLYSGAPRRSREAYLFAERLDPNDAFTVLTRSNVAASFYFERDYESAVSYARRLLADCPDHPWANRWLAAALGQLGHLSEAHEALQRAIANGSGTFVLYVRKRVPWMRTEDYAHMLEGLIKAGWQA